VDERKDSQGSCPTVEIIDNGKLSKVILAVRIIVEVYGTIELNRTILKDGNSCGYLFGAV
jgi:hypothetical protein